MDEELRLRAEQSIGHVFANPALLELALTHSSGARTRSESNERLEFLGDAVLGVSICEHLFLRFPSLLEGDLTKLKSLVVSRKICAQISGQAGFLGLLKLGKGMKDARGLPQSVAAAVFESIVGAVYLDAGFLTARALVLRHMEPFIDQGAAEGHHENFKSVLQQVALDRGLGVPIYHLMDEKGPDHAKCFEVCAGLGARRFSARWGMTKKAAEQSAAQVAIDELGVLIGGRSVTAANAQAPSESRATKASTKASTVKSPASTRKSAKRS